MVKIAGNIYQWIFDNYPEKLFDDNDKGEYADMETIRSHDCSGKHK